MHKMYHVVLKHGPRATARFSAYTMASGPVKAVKKVRERAASALGMGNCSPGQLRVAFPLCNVTETRQTEGGLETNYAQPKD